MITQEELQRWDWQGRQKKADYSILCCPALWKIEEKRKHELTSHIPNLSSNAHMDHYPLLLYLVGQSCLTLCNRMDCSAPNFPALHYLPSLLKLMSIKSVMPSNHLVLYYLLLSWLSRYLEGLVDLLRTNIVHLAPSQNRTCQDFRIFNQNRTALVTAMFDFKGLLLK